MIFSPSGELAGKDGWELGRACNNPLRSGLRGGRFAAARCPPRTRVSEASSPRLAAVPGEANASRDRHPAPSDGVASSVARVTAATRASMFRAAVEAGPEPGPPPSACSGRSGGQMEIRSARRLPVPTAPTDPRAGHCNGLASLRPGLATVGSCSAGMWPLHHRLGMFAAPLLHSMRLGTNSHLMTTS